MQCIDSIFIVKNKIKKVLRLHIRHMKQQTHSQNVDDLHVNFFTGWFFCWNFQQNHFLYKHLYFPPFFYISLLFTDGTYEKYDAVCSSEVWSIKDIWNIYICMFFAGENKNQVCCVCWRDWIFYEFSLVVYKEKLVPRHKCCVTKRNNNLCR